MSAPSMRRPCVLAYSVRRPKLTDSIFACPYSGRVRLLCDAWTLSVNNLVRSALIYLFTVSSCWPFFLAPLTVFAPRSFFLFRSFLLLACLCVSGMAFWYKILSLLQDRDMPEECQTLLFSATYPPDLLSLVPSVLRRSRYVRLKVGRLESDKERIFGLPRASGSGLTDPDPACLSGELSSESPSVGANNTPTPSTPAAPPHVSIKQVGLTRLSLLHQMDKEKETQVDGRRREWTRRHEK